MKVIRGVDEFVVLNNIWFGFHVENLVNMNDGSLGNNAMSNDLMGAICNLQLFND